MMARAIRWAARQTMDRGVPRGTIIVALAVSAWAVMVLVILLVLWVIGGLA